MIDRQKEEEKACWLCLAIGYFVLYIPIASALGIINLEALTLESILFMIGFFLVIALILIIIRACDKFSTIDNDSRE